ncbi:putative porin [Pseudoalteromonas fenneropenaei]|uniref:Porin n=1 Tax=Pseudoalteromonas fenneropenaei TaxID=1737459 RepID=A0ABV7CJK6_9GAMM
MRSLLSVSILGLLSCASVQAAQLDTKQWFNGLSYTNVDVAHGSNLDVYAFATQYYLEAQDSSGVWDDYGYIDTDSNFYAFGYDAPGSDALGFGGEYFFNQFFVTAEVQDVDNFDNHSIGLGYLVSDNLKLSIRNQAIDNGSDVQWFKAEYLHYLNDTDYLGFNANIDDEFDAWSVSARYLKNIEADSYFTLDAEYLDNDGDGVFSAMADYYFTRNFALGAGVNDSDLQLEAKYFFNSSYYLTAHYLDRDNAEMFNLEFVAQF